jgi:hypothetical protein
MALDQDLLDTLIAFKSDLLDWVIHASPTSDAERQQVRQVLELRDRLSQELNALVGLDLHSALGGLPEDVARLESATATMKSVQRNIESAQKVLDAAGTVASVAAKLVTIVAAA